MSSSYINLTLNLEKFTCGQYDLRVPTSLSMKELLHIVIEAYHLDLTVTQPSMRVYDKGIVLTALQRLEDVGHLHDGIHLIVETL